MFILISVRFVHENDTIDKVVSYCESEKVAQGIAISMAIDGYSVTIEKAKEDELPALLRRQAF